MSDPIFQGCTTWMWANPPNAQIYNKLRLRIGQIRIQSLFAHPNDISETAWVITKNKAPFFQYLYIQIKIIHTFGRRCYVYWGHYVGIWQKEKCILYAFKRRNMYGRQIMIYDRHLDGSISTI